MTTGQWSLPQNFRQECGLLQARPQRLKIKQSSCQTMAFLKAFLSATMNWNKILSASVAVIYCLLALWFGGLLPLVQTAGMTFVVLMVIWNADDIGSYTGATASGWITSPTPAWIIRIFGWIVLLIPIALIIYGQKKN